LRRAQPALLFFFINTAPIAPIAPAAKAIPPTKRFVFFFISNLKFYRLARGPETLRKNWRSEIREFNLQGLFPGILRRRGSRFGWPRPARLSDLPSIIPPAH
jgi:hypothetical protein